MTDNKILKALEWCNNFEYNIVFNGNGDEKCVQALQTMVIIKHALKNYNCQKSLEDDLKRACAERDARIATQDFLKKEAIKEFVERLKEKYYVGIFKNPGIEFVVRVRDIENLVQEMVGDENG